MNFWKPKYLIRLDDASHFSNLEKWNKVEYILNRYNVKPLVAVIPNNMDNNLMYSAINKNFWNMIKEWQIKGWEIAMHGYNHVYHKCNRYDLIFPFYNRSEFGGLTLNEQIEKLKNANKLFISNNIKPRLWVAPSHTFDLKTLEALKKSTDIRIISDGIAYSTFFENGFNFIPQQLWDFKNKFYGTWTICLHPDTMTERELINLDLFLKNKSIKNQIIEFKDLVFNKRGLKFSDKIYSNFFWIKYNLKLNLKKYLFINE
jgi:predicted deacetylase